MQQFDENAITARYREYQERRKLLQIEQAELQRQRAENKKAWDALRQKHTNQITLHPVVIRRDFKCADCDGHIEKGSRVMSRRIKATRRNAHKKVAGDDWFVTGYLTLHFCNKCEPLRERVVQTKILENP